MGEGSGRRPAHEELKLKDGEFTTSQVIERTGVHPRTFDYWASRGLVTPVRRTGGTQGRGKGSRRIWNGHIFDNVRDLARKIDECPYDHNKAIR